MTHRKVSLGINESIWEERGTSRDFVFTDAAAVVGYVCSFMMWVEVMTTQSRAH